VNASHQAGPPLKGRLEAGLTLVGKTRDTDVVSIDDVAKIRKSIESGGLVPAPSKHKIIAAAEACLLLGVGDGPEAKGLTVEYYRAFLEHETFPQHWGKSKHWFNLGFGLTNLIPCMAKLGVDKAMVNPASVPYLGSGGDSQ